VPSRKQRRRRQKSRRHEYEYVYVDEEGREVDVVDPGELRKERDEKPAAGASGARTGRTGRTGGGRPARKVEPPSWRRVGRRALIFAPLMFITVSLLGRGLTIGQRVVETLFLLVFFLPFSYVMDTVVYRSYLRRTGQAPPSRRGGSNGRA
jgi:hypothetical protein